MLKGVLFDLDGTLLNRDESVLRSLVTNTIDYNMLSVILTRKPILLDLSHWINGDMFGKIEYINSS
mgnify:CR=1 FL=1